jgi:hypothetical protein
MGGLLNSPTRPALLAPVPALGQDPFMNPEHFNSPLSYFLISAFQLLYINYKRLSNVLLAPVDHLQVRDVAMLLPFQNRINLLQRLALRLHPVVHDRCEHDDVPGAVGHIGLPANACECDGRRENNEQSCAVKSELENAHPIGADGVVEDFRGVEVEQGCPAETVGPLE